MDFIDLLTLPVKNVSIISYLINLFLVFIFSKFLSILYLKYKITPLIKDEISGNLVYISLATDNRREEITIFTNRNVAKEI